MTFQDILGREVSVGDTVALGVRDGNSGGLVIREVTKIVTKEYHGRSYPAISLKNPDTGRTGQSSNIQNMVKIWLEQY